jgi:hypothetical protein
VSSSSVAEWENRHGFGLTASRPGADSKLALVASVASSITDNGFVPNSTTDYNDDDGKAGFSRSKAPCQGHRILWRWIGVYSHFPEPPE